MNTGSYELHKEMERAIVFASREFGKTPWNSKPALLHSIRVGLYLDKNGYSRNPVLGGLLHDVIEDTDATTLMVEEEFGREVRSIVEALTRNEAINDRTGRAVECFERCRKAGPEALMVCAADMLDNLPYYRPDGAWEGFSTYFIPSFEAFLKMAAQDIGKEIVYQELAASFPVHVKKMTA